MMLFQRVMVDSGPKIGCREGFQLCLKLFVDGEGEEVIGRRSFWL